MKLEDQPLSDLLVCFSEVEDGLLRTKGRNGTNLAADRVIGHTEAIERAEAWQCLNCGAKINQKENLDIAQFVK